MILASQSPRRRELLEGLGVSLTILPACVDEGRLPGEGPVELVERLAQSKAEVARLLLGGMTDERVLVAADTIVWTEDGHILGKPRDGDDARAMLRELSGRTHHVSTGCCALVLSPAAQVLSSTSFVETTAVEFHTLTGSEVDTYVASGEPMDKAGAYGIQGLGRLLVRQVRGDYFNVVGLPVARLVRELASLGPFPSLTTTLLGGAHHDGA